MERENLPRTRRRPRALLAVALATASLLAATINARAGAYDPPFPYEGYHNFPGNGAGDNGYYRFPYSTIGKFYYTDQGVNKVCSGSVVNGPKSGGVVFTAAHCLYNAQAGVWTTNWAFAPSFDNGNQPFGLWSSWKQAEISQAYFRGDLQYAFGFVTFNPNNGQTLINAVGGLGLVINASYLQHWHVYGYPDADTNRQWLCTASWAMSDIPSDGSEPPTLGVGCNQTQGMGGGPWLMQTKPGDITAYLNSVSIYTGSSSGGLFGDYFDSFAGTLYGDAESGKCSC